MIQPMQHLWAPWRMEFIKAPKPSGCFFCEAASADPSDDALHLVLARGEFALVILNRYPYNNGHLMIAPYAHLANLEDVPVAPANELMVLTQRSLRVLRQVLAPQGFNLGINAGKIAGAGVADHVHQHVVPRWDGDTNFMPVVADTKVLNESLTKSYQQLRAGFDRKA
jgi:ATP adenylyltransferase